ncbi:MAG: dihydropteroate synthase [Hormoscilla sp. GM7CHS1pb]|nr:dihydropteroate synthase [Hormoscilla sp. GM7CHS1pb]
MIIRGKLFEWGARTYLMGILNVTPDSFSDGGEFSSIKAAVIQARRMVAAGADIIDIGGQSTRPGSSQITLQQELDRVLPVINQIRQGPDEWAVSGACRVLQDKSMRKTLAEMPISIDTTRAEVAYRAIALGADIVNDISGGTFDPDMFSVVAQKQVPTILMHIRGTPQTMQKMTDYEDLIGEIYGFLEGRIDAAVEAGIERSRLIVDPGIGFAKTGAQNLEIFRQMSRFRALGVPILVGPSRKSFIGHLLHRPTDPKGRVWGTAAACVGAIAGGADILRVHDVAEMRDVCRVADAIFRG